MQYLFLVFWLASLCITGSRCFDDNFWHSLAYGNITLISVFIVTRCSVCVCVCMCVHLCPILFTKDSSHIGSGTTLLQYELILSRYICRDPVSTSGHFLGSWGLGLHMDWGKTIQIINSNIHLHMQWMFSLIAISMFSKSVSLFLFCK